RRHRLLAFERSLDVWRQRLHLLCLTFLFVLFEARHYLGSKQIERFADVLVPVVAALLNENRLIHATALEFSETLDELCWRADTSSATAQHLESELLAHRDEFLPDVSPPRRVLAEAVVMPERELEEPKPVGAAPSRFVGITMAREAGDHR